MTAHILVSTDPGGLVGRITLNRPDRCNAVSTDMARTIGQAFKEFGATDQVKVIVIDAVGPDLTSGTDPADAEAAIRAAPGGAEGKVPSQRARLIAADDVWWGLDGLFQRVLHSRKVTILAATGACLDVGLHLALCADLVVASDTARFGCPRFRHVGVNGDISLLIAAVGLKRAKDIIYAGAEWNAAEAQSAGLLDTVVAQVEVPTQVAELATRCALVMRDAITPEKQVVFASLAKMGVSLGFAAASVVAGWGTNLHFRKGEFNFLREARTHGIDAALRLAEDHFAGP